MLRKISFLLFAVLLAACSGVKNQSSGGNGGGSGSGSGGQGGSVSLSGLVVTPPAATLIVSKTQSLQATGTFSDGSTKDLTASVTWSSADTTTASVSAAGVVTGSATGVTSVTARSGSFSASTQITVTAANVCATPISIAVTPTNPTIPVNTTQQLVATGTNSDASKCDITDLVTWSSSTIANATVSASGLVQGVGAGSATITATLGSVTGSTPVTVTAPTITSISIDQDDMTLPIGVGEQYTVSAIYNDGSIQDLVTGVTWTSSNPSVATVDSNGLVTTLAAGTTTITATVGTFTDSSVITVVAAHLQSITLTPTNVTMASSTQQQFTAVGNFDDGSTQVLVSALWSSSATSVLTIDQNGMAQAVAPGTSTVSVTSGSVSANTSVTVSTATLVSLGIAPASSSMPANATKQFSATGTFSDNSTQDVTQLVLWSSSAPSVATITNLGLASSLTTGTTTITAMFGAVSNSTTLTVSNVKLASIAITPANGRVQKGTSLKFTAVGTYSDGSTATLTNVSWRSSKNNLANLRANGILHAKKAGTLTVTASAFGVTASTAVTIGTGTLLSVDITPANPSAAHGSTQQFIALGTFSDGSTQDVSISAHWSSTVPSVATIANAPVNAGLATTKTTGTTTIGVNHGGNTASTSLFVN